MPLRAGKVPMEEPEKSLMQKAGDVVATCSFRRFMPLPIGAFLMSIVSVPWCILYFPATTFRHIPHIVTAVQRLNHSKYLYYVSANTSDDACCNSCCKYFHPYLLMYLIVTLVLFIVVLPLLLVIFPILGVVHATYAVARRTYTESDMYDEAQDGGILDSLGIGDSKKGGASAEANPRALASLPCSEISPRLVMPRPWQRTLPRP
eukprot:6538956-Prymnesium_polylepis.1